MLKWCTYSWFGKMIPSNIGQASFCGSSPLIKYNEYQEYPLESWDKKYVKTFSTLEGAICFMCTNSNLNIREIKELVISKFPTSARKVHWNIILRTIKLKKIANKFGK